MDEAKFWIMPRTRTAQEPVDSTATGVTAKGFDLSRDLIDGLPELEDQIFCEKHGASGQARAEYAATTVRDLQPFDVQFRDNRAPHSLTGAVGAGTVFSRSIIDDRPANAAPWRVEIEYAPGNTVSFDVQFRYRKTISADLFELGFQPTGPVT